MRRIISIKTGIIMVTLSMILTVTMSISPLVNAAASSGMVYGDDHTLTRAEWVHDLVLLFEMQKDEKLYPDLYYPDLNEGTDYYSDIMTAIGYGVIDLEAGSNFGPEEDVTREFAASTLNYCLGFVNEQDSYSFSDEEINDKDSCQVAVDRGWLAPVNGEFLPDQVVTVAEVKKMCQDAQNLINETKIDTEYNSTYKFDDDVVIVPEETDIDIDDDVINIHDTSVSINKNDIFVVYINGIAVTYTATEVNDIDDGISVVATESEEGITEIDAQGEVAADDFIPADGVEYTILEEEISSKSDPGNDANGGNESGDLIYEDTINSKLAPEISGTRKANKDLKFEKIKVPGTGEMVTVGIIVSNITIKYNINSKEHKATMLASADVRSTVNVKAKYNFSTPLGTAKVPGIGTVDLVAYVKVDGSVQVSFVNHVEFGVSYDSMGFRIVHSFTNVGQPKMTADFSVDTGLELSASLYKSVPVLSASAYAKTGIVHKIHADAYDDYKTPKVCQHRYSFLYAEVGANASVDFGIIKKSLADEKLTIWGPDTSPARSEMHIEDGQLVPQCTRNPEKYRNFFSKWNSWYGGYGWYGFDSAGEIVPIFTYTLDDDGNATITGYTGRTSILNIPEEVDGHPVVAIGNGAFKGDLSLLNVTIPDSVTQIGDSAFYKCRQLSDVNLPKKLVSIGRWVFTGTPIKSIFIPQSLKKIGYYNNGPFEKCTELKEVEFEEGITHIAYNLFEDCTGLEQIVIPDSVTEIESGAFSGCSNITSVKIPESVTQIGDSVFYNCRRLSDVNLPKKLVSIGRWVFTGTPIKSIFIPQSLKKIGYYNTNGPFEKCTELKEVEFEEGITHIAYNLFEDCTGLERIVIPNSVTEIESGAFSGCSNITSVKIPESVTQIGDSVFYNCGQLSDVNLPSKLVSIGSWVFTGTPIKSIFIPQSLQKIGYYNINGPFEKCTELKEVEFEEGITHIAYNLFDDCTGLERIVIPDSVTKIESGAFNGCINLKEITIPNTVTSMGTGVFKGCTHLTKAKIPDNRINIVEQTFYGCTSLVEVNFPDTLEAIKESAFYNCSSLNGVVIPEKVNTIEKNAFYGCTSLEKMNIPSSVRTINSSAFSHCESLKDLSIAKGVTTINANAFEYNKLLQKVILPDTLTSLGEKAFQYCDELSEVKIGAGLKTVPKYCFYEDPALVSIVLPQQMTTVSDYAFGNCTKFTDITMNRNIAKASLNAFSYPDKLTIHGVSGTYAETFAKDNSIKFVPLSSETAEIKLNKTELKLGRGYTTKLTASIVPDDSADEFTWLSSDESIATVDKDGNVKGIKVGSTSIIAMSGSVMEFCEVTVYEPVSSVRINRSSFTGTTGDTVQLKATVYPDIATHKDVIWSTDDEKIATVDKDGLVTLGGFGTTKITVTTKNMSKTATCTITVKAIAVTGVTLDEKAVALNGHEQKTLVATVQPENASNKNVTWTSSKPSVVSVKDGVLTGVSGGTAIIVVKTEDGSKTATCTVTVTEPEHLSASIANVVFEKIPYGFDDVTAEEKAEKVILYNNTDNDITDINVSLKVGDAFIISDTGTLIAGNETADITITPKSGIASGIYEDEITITSSENTITIPVSLEVEKAESLGAVEVSLIKRTSSTVTIDSVIEDAEDDVIAEYAIVKKDSSINSNTKWQEDKLFTGLNGATEYTIYARIKETDNYKSGVLSTGLNVYTLSDDPYSIDVSKIADDEYQKILSVAGSGEEVPTVEVKKSVDLITVKLLDTSENYTITGNNKNVTVDTNGVSSFKLDNATIGKVIITGSADDDIKMQLSGSNSCDSVTSNADSLTISEEMKGSALTVDTTSDVGIESTGDVIFDSGIVNVNAKETAIHADSVKVNDAAIDAGVNGGADSKSVIIADTSVQLLGGSVTTAKDDYTEGYDIEVLSEDGDIVIDTLVNISENATYSKVPVDAKGNEIHFIVVAFKDGNELLYTGKYRVGETIKISDIDIRDNLGKSLYKSGYSLKWKLNDKEYGVDDSITISNSDMTFTSVWTKLNNNTDNNSENSNGQPGSNTNPLESGKSGNESATGIQGDNSDRENDIIYSVGQVIKDPSGKYNYRILNDKNVAFVSAINKKSKSVVIPDNVTLGSRIYNVTEISSNALKNYKKLTNVTIGKNVNKIGKNAFNGCKKLSKITIKSSSLKSVGKNAIKGINKKATIKVPKKKLSKYKKIFKSSTGYKKTMKIK